MSPERKQDLDRVEAALQTLSEHFDTVQIFCTRHESGEENGTVNVNRGMGNWFARYGQVMEWIVREEETSRESRRGREGEP